MQMDKIISNSSLPAYEKIRSIENAIVKELGKAQKKIDIGIVRSYERLVVELGGEVCEKDETALAENLEHIKRQAENSKNCANRSIMKTHRKPLLRVAVAIIAVVMIVISSFNIYAASVGGYGVAWEYISSSINELFGKGPGKENINGVTVITPDHTKKYGNIDELMENEKMNLLYPAELPENVKPKEISQIFYNDGKYKILFVFTDRSTSIEVTDMPNFSDEFILERSSLTIHGIDIYIDTFTFPEGEQVQAVFHYKGLEYTVVGNDENTVIQIIENMKGF